MIPPLPRVHGGKSGDTARLRSSSLRTRSPRASPGSSTCLSPTSNDEKTKSEEKQNDEDKDPNDNVYTIVTVIDGKEEWFFEEDERSRRFYLTGGSESSFSNQAWTKDTNKVYFVTFLNPFSRVCFMHHFWVEIKERITSVFTVECILRDLKWLYHVEDNHLLIFCVFSGD
jgi:hypothetical protein